MSKPIPEVFGSVFHHQMPIAFFTNDCWSPTRWQASDRLTLHPAAHALHYGSAVFEGMKAFRHGDDSVHIFRLEAHVERMRKSAEALYLVPPDKEQLQTMIVELVRRARAEVPDERGSLYIRPLLLGSDPLIGNAACPARDAVLLVLASPSGDYFRQGSPLTLLVETENQRCAPHMGSVKSGGNYACALHWTMQAKKTYGADQVLFCPHGDVQETGAANFVLIDGNTLLTKGLSREFLHGVTRDSLLRLARDNGYNVEERDFTVEELREKIKNGAEAVLTGTAAVLSPVTALIIDGEKIALTRQLKGLELRTSMTDIQYGRSPDPYGWLTEVRRGG